MPDLMASDRMMQAIGALERAIDRLEQEMEGRLASGSTDPQIGFDAVAARAALTSLDELIAELKGQASG